MILQPHQVWCSSLEHFMELLEKMFSTTLLIVLNKIPYWPLIMKMASQTQPTAENDRMWRKQLGELKNRKTERKSRTWTLLILLNAILVAILFPAAWVIKSLLWLKSSMNLIIYTYRCYLHPYVSQIRWGPFGALRTLHLWKQRRMVLHVVKFHLYTNPWAKQLQPW